jgi:hypothetical protein
MSLTFLFCLKKGINISIPLFAIKFLLICYNELVKVRCCGAFTASDDGPGFEKDEEKQMFKRFCKRKTRIPALVSSYPNQ